MLSANGSAGVGVGLGLPDLGCGRCGGGGELGVMGPGAGPIRESEGPAQARYWWRCVSLSPGTRGVPRAASDSDDPRGAFGAEQCGGGKLRVESSNVTMPASSVCGAVITPSKTKTLRTQVSWT